jgi:DNA-binding NtrC family response regulator
VNTSRACPCLADRPESLETLLGKRENRGRTPDGLFPDDILEGRELPELRRELEKSYLCRLFRETGGDIRAMTDRLGVQRSNLYTWF